MAGKAIFSPGPLHEPPKTIFSPVCNEYFTLLQCRRNVNPFLSVLVILNTKSTLLAILPSISATRVAHAMWAVPEISQDSQQ